MSVERAIRSRYSVRQFSERPVTREEIEALLELAVQAPNHRMTEPWRFVVVGTEGKRALARVLGRRKSSKVTDPEAARLVREKVERTTMALPVVSGGPSLPQIPLITTTDTPGVANSTAE